MSAPPPSHDLDEVAPIPILPGPGEQLRAAREAAGMSVHEISTHMRLDSRIILALESDDYEQLPAPTFIRGYLRGYARLLDLPPEPIIQSFEQRDFAPPSLVADLSVRSQVRSGDFPFRLVTYVVVAALILLVVLWWRSQDFPPVSFDALSVGEPEVSEAEPAMPEDVAMAPEPKTFASPVGSEETEPEATDSEGLDPQSTATVDERAESELEGIASDNQMVEPESEAVASAAEEEEAAAATLMSESEAAGAEPESGEGREDSAEAVGAGEEAAAPAPEESIPPAPEDSPPSEAPAEAEPEADTGVAAEPEASTEEDASETPTAPSEEPALPSVEAEEERLPGTDAPADRLGMTFVVECWLEVYDNADERLFYGLAQPGEQLSLSGQGPIRLVLGNSVGVEVSFNGTPVDFSAFTARGVARFSVGGEPPTAFPTSAASESAGEPESAGA